MRLFPILAAIVVSALIYVFIFERDRLLTSVSKPPAETSQPAEQEDAPQAQTEDAVRVVAVKSIARSIDNAVILRGETKADRQVSLRAETSGQVISDPLRRGHFVAAGDVMCELDPGTRMSALAEARARLSEAVSRVPEAEARVPESEARVTEAEARVEEAIARLEEARINVNAAEKLSEGGFASETRVASTLAAVRGAEAAIETAAAGLKTAQSNLESVAAGIEAARAGVEGARAAVALAEKEIDRLTITAPFDGVLEGDTAELGSLLQPGDVCADIMQLNPIVLVGYVPETQVSRVELGAAATGLLSDGDKVTGTVSFISRSADPSTRTFQVDVKAPNADLMLRDGQTVEITIAAAGTQAHLLPQSALTLDNQGQLGVRIVETGGLTAFRPITLLRDTPTGVWVGGLAPEVDVIIIGQDFVDEGVPVQASYQETLQ